MPAFRSRLNTGQIGKMLFANAVEALGDGSEVRYPHGSPARAGRSALASLGVANVRPVTTTTTPLP